MAENTTESRGAQPDAPTGRGTTVLLVGRDARILRDVVGTLRQSGYAVRSVRSGPEAQAALAEAPADVVVLDFSRRGNDQLVELGDLKNANPGQPIVLIGRTRQAHDVVLGLRLGADDVIGWPVDVAELCARLDAVVRRALPHPLPGAMPAQGVVTGVGDLRIDRAAGVATIGRAPLSLTQTEFSVLRALADGPDRLLSRRELVDAVWGGCSTPDSRAVDVHVDRLRRKMRSLRPGAPTILSVRLQGYRLAAAESKSWLLDEPADVSSG
jgi:DNA-binding response OmpR family regulator